MAKSNGTKELQKTYPIALEKRGDKQVEYVPFSASLDLEGITISEQDDTRIQFPRIKLLQGLSQEVNRENDAQQQGAYYNAVLEENLGNTITFIPLLRFKDRLFFEANEKNLVCMSRDGAGMYGMPMSADIKYEWPLVSVNMMIDGVVTQQSVVQCQTCQFSQWQNKDGKRVPPVCKPVSVFVGIMKHDFEDICNNVEKYMENSMSELFSKLCIIDFKSTSWRAGEDLLQRLILRGGAVFNSYATIRVKRVQDKFNYFTSELVDMTTVDPQHIPVARGLSKFAEKFRSAIHGSVSETVNEFYEDSEPVNIDPVFIHTGAMKSKHIDLD